MKVKDCFGTGDPVFSFEFFPPKSDQGVETLFETIRELHALSPSFVSVTYGAGGSTRERTIELVGRIKREIGLEAMAHLTCVGHSRDEIGEILDRLAAAGIENVLALRGDPPKGESEFQPHPDGFAYASELVGYIREGSHGFCLGGAAYPEGHVEAVSRDVDLDNLMRKVEAGVDFLVTQLFFDNTDYFEFVERVRALGVSLPIVPGIMPVTNVGQIERFTKMCGASIPPALRKVLEPVRDDEEAVVQTGIDYATEQCQGLLDGGAPGIHFYTLNRSPATRRIFENLGRAPLGEA
ncbi:MAG: methylenetetrahydrofolate reductase [NAD(P)H] [Planctomycetota bacterium]